MIPSDSHTWLSSLGHVFVSLTLSVYTEGQPSLALGYGDGAREELTISVPGFDLRSYDADFGFQRLHLIFRSQARAELLAGCDLISLCPHAFTVAASGETALQLVWLPTPPAWQRIRRGAIAA